MVGKEPQSDLTWAVYLHDTFSIVFYDLRRKHTRLLLGHIIAITSIKRVCTSIEKWTASGFANPDL